MSDTPPPSEWAPRPSNTPLGHDGHDRMPPPPDGGPPPPPQTRDGCGTVARTAAILFGILVVAIGGCSVWIFTSVQPVIDEANEFMADLATDDLASAADHTSTADTCFGTNPLSELVALAERVDVVSYNLTGTELSSINSEDSEGSSSGTVTLADGSTMKAIVLMVEEEDEWKVCSVQFEPLQ